MHPGQVVVLHEVLADELVVRGDVVGAGPLRDPLVEPVLGEALGQVAELGGQRRGVRRQVDEDEQAPRVDGDVEQAVVGAVEALRHRRVEDRLLAGGDVGVLEQRRPEARPVGVVGPVVVRAADAPALADLAGVAVEELRRAVAAEVVEGAQRAVPVAGDEDRPAGDLDDDAGAGLRDVAGDADRDPAGGEQPLLLEREELRRGVGVGQQRRRELDGQAGRCVGALVGEQRRIDGTRRQRGVRIDGCARGVARHGCRAPLGRAQAVVGAPVRPSWPVVLLECQRRDSSASIESSNL